MAVFSKDENRNIIPRWRTYEVTRRTKELDSVAAPPVHRLVVSDFLASKIVDWQRNRTVAHASDLVGAALTLGREQEVAEAARFLLREDLSVTSWARELAERALSRDLESNETVVSTTMVEKSTLHEQIRTLRNLVRTEPNDPITWVDLSRSYACVGLSEQAARNMTVALKLAIDNRFVLRSASRLWVNLGDPERAHDIMLRTDRTRHDPWLLAAEIAIGNMDNRQSQFVNTARRMVLQGQFSPAHISELASAVATLELSSGSIRKSKKWFSKSLEMPTENSVAQVSWASRQYSSINFDSQYLELPNTFEAESWNYYQNGQWRRAVEQCKQWFFDQSFVSNPCILGSYVSAIALEDYSTSEWFANVGLTANPSDFMLMNNLAFALISRGDLVNTREVLSKVDRLQLSYRDQIVRKATHGLFEFRSGNFTRGRELYLDACSEAKTMPGKDGELVFALASTFHAIEEARNGGFDAQPMLSDALHTIKGHPDPIFRVLEQKLLLMMGTERAPSNVRESV